MDKKLAKRIGQELSVIKVFNQDFKENIVDILSVKNAKVQKKVILNHILGILDQIYRDSSDIVEVLIVRNLVTVQKRMVVKDKLFMDFIKVMNIKVFEKIVNIAKKGFTVETI